MKRCAPSESSVLPAGISAWDQVLRDGNLAAPWPYSEEQFGEICQLGELSNINLQTIVVLAARRYIFVERSLKTRPATHSDGDQLAKLTRAVADLRTALTGLGDGAFEHLAAHREGGPPKAFRPEPPAVAEARKAAREHFRRVRAQELVQENLTAIEWALDRFTRDNASALAVLPRNRRGRPSRKHEKWLHWRLEKVFRLAHNGQRGFPAFYEACGKPLGLPSRSPKGVEELRQSVLRRANKHREKGADKSDLTRTT